MEVHLDMTGQIVVVTGPTATGKTRLGIMLAQELGGEIVSADSMQIYRGMDIGTAKPTREELAAAPHHLIDVAQPEEGWSVSRWTEAADAACRDILARGKRPIIVGGTGLYIDSLVQGRSFAGRTEDGGECRRELEERYEEIGGAAMLRELAQLDPQRAAKLHARDKKRIVRAYEVYLLTGGYPYGGLYMLQHFMNNTFESLDYQKLSAAAVIMALAMVVIIAVLFKVEDWFGKDVEG